MKKLILITLLFGSVSAYSQSGWFEYFKADKFYSTTGTGLGNAPWDERDIEELNAEQAAMPDGTRIGIKAGEVWPDTIVIGKANLIFKRYSIGANPIIDMFYDPESYTYVSIGINTTALPVNSIIDPNTNEYFIDPATGEKIIDPGI